MWMSWTQQKWLPMTGWYGQPRDWWPWYKEAPQPLRQAGCSWQVFQRCWDLKQKNEWVETPFSGPRLPLKQDRVQTPPWQHERALMAWWAWVWVQKGDPKFQAGGEGERMVKPGKPSTETWHPRHRHSPGTSSKPEWRKADLLRAGFRNTARFPQGLDRVKTLIIIIVDIITWHSLV